MWNKLFSVIVITFTYFIQINSLKYEPKWDSLESRELPDWYDKGKVGIFVHWGVYSVPSFSSEWFWNHWKAKKPSREIMDFMRANYKPKFSYQDFAHDFTGEFFDPTEWADLFEKSGARYVVMTSKHHDGYTMWPSIYSPSWNSVDVGLHRDVIGELQKAVNSKQKLKFGLYYSLLEWFHPMYIKDRDSSFSTKLFVDNKVIPEMKELINTYKPEIFWTDGEWEALSEYWKSEEFLSWLYNESPVKDSVVVNDRWGKDTLCTHGGSLTCADRFTPDKMPTRKWENAMTLDANSWGYNRKSNIDDYVSTQELINKLARTVALGGNILINVGPSHDGRINPVFQERLSDLGDWLSVNGDAIYESKAWEKCRNDTSQSDIWYTTKPNPKSGKDLYAMILKWPKDNILLLACPVLPDDSRVTMLGLSGYSVKAQMIHHMETQRILLKIILPSRALIETNWVWTLKIRNIT